MHYEKLLRNEFGAARGNIQVPRIFSDSTFPERLLRRDMGIISSHGWPRNQEVQWRLSALSRFLSLDMPRPYRAPFLKHFGGAAIPLRRGRSPLSATPQPWHGS